MLRERRRYLKVSGSEAEGSSAESIAQESVLVRRKTSEIGRKDEQVKT